MYKLKTTTDGKNIRYKARLVVKGFTQQEGIDYTETFSPVVKFASIRAILAISVARNMNLMQFDVKTAFLHGDLTDVIYMKQPEGFNDKTDRVCRLLKSLYGLKQFARCWNIKFTKVLAKFNLKACDADPCVFISKNNKELLIVGIYIDDGLVAATSHERACDFLNSLSIDMEIVSNKPSLFLGMEFKWFSDGSLMIHQQKYSKKILDKFHLEEANNVSTPIDHYQDLSLDDKKGKLISKAVPFKEAIGSLLYLTIISRPDIAYAVSIVSQYAETPKKIHWNAIKRIFKYIKGTLYYGILIKSNIQNISFEAFSDADFAGDKITRKSTTDYIIRLEKSLIVWGSQKQKCIALSTTESEYIAASQTVKELIWISNLINELDNQVKKPILYVDNQSAIKLIKNPEYHKRTKHIDIKYHFIRHHYINKLFDLQYINTENQIADILTKPLCKNSFGRLRDIIMTNEREF